MIIIIIKQFIKLVARKLKLCQLAETPYRMLPFSHVGKADLCTGKVMRMMPRCKSKAGVTLVEPYPRTVTTINFILFKPFTPEEGLAQSVSTRPSVLNVPILIPSNPSFDFSRSSPPVTLAKRPRRRGARRNGSFRRLCYLVTDVK